MTWLLLIIATGATIEFPSAPCHVLAAEYPGLACVARYDA